MARWRFTKDYDHKWPSRAVSAYKAGFVGVLKREVLLGAQARSAVEPVDPPESDNGGE